MRGLSSRCMRETIEVLFMHGIVNLHEFVGEMYVL